MIFAALPLPHGYAAAKGKFVERLYLPDHAWFSYFDKQAVFIDLRSDEYLELEEKVCTALRELAANGGVPNEHLLSALQEQIDYGLLTPNESNARPILPTTSCPAKTPLLEDDAAAPDKIGAREFKNFLYACLRVDLRLRWGHILNTITRLKHMKKQARKQHFDVHRARELVAAFKKLRPLYPRKYLCMFDTLALIEFLAPYRIVPTYVAGYNHRGGEGHCWAQFGDLLCLEDPEYVARHTPVLVI